MNGDKGAVSGYELGQRVRFTKPIQRRSVPLHPIEKIEKLGGAEYKRSLLINKAWIPNEFAGEQEGIIVGQRTLSNGHRTWEEYGYEYCPAEHFTAYMVVTSLRSAPVHVLPEHITPLEES